MDHNTNREDHEQARKQHKHEQEEHAREVAKQPPLIFPRVLLFGGIAVILALIIWAVTIR